MKKIGYVKRIWALCAPFRRYMALVLFLLFLNQAANALFPMILGSIVTSVSQGKKEAFLLAIGTWLLIGVARSAISFARERFEVKNLDYEISRHLSSLSMEKFFNISMGQHQTGHSIIKRSVIQKGEAAIAGVVNISIYDLVPVSLMILIPTFLLFIIAPMVGLLVLMTIACFITYTLRYTSKFVPKLRDLDSMANKIGRKHGEFVQNVEVVYVNAQEARVRRECDDDNVTIGNSGTSVWISFLNWFYCGQWFLVFSHISCNLLAGYLVFTGKIQVGMFVTVSMWVGSALGTLTNISHIQRSLSRSLSPIEKYFRFLDYKTDIIMSENPIPMGNVSGRIEFRDVGFSYKARSDKDTFNDGENEEDKVTPKSEEIVHTIRDISFVLEAGKRYAFVGKSGAGKSTMVGLILRAFDPQSGHVLVDGVDVRMLDYRELRRNIGLVPQDVSLFDGTLRYNVTFGLNGSASKVTEEEFSGIAKLSRISEFISTLEKGWDTMIGERGVKLSGGQRQRVGIARALIKSPSILIFDEATSSLDTENEAGIRESIREASKGKTTIIIAHRLATVRDADEILVFDDGKMVGKGTHEELLKSNEYYQRLVQNQVILG